MYLVSNERRENALDNEAYSFVSVLRGNEDISLMKRVSFLLGRTVQISSETLYERPQRTILLKHFRVGHHLRILKLS